MAFRRARNPEGRMSLGDHLRELRRRVVISALAVFVGAVLGWIYYLRVYNALAAPFNDYKRANPHSTISLNFGNATAAFSQQVSDYFSVVTRFILAFGAAFLLPVLLVALNAIGVLPARAMIRAWRPAVFGIFVLSAIATPTPDAFTMFLLAIPLCVLYFAAILVSRLIERRRRQNRPEWVDVSDDEASSL
jgi:Sec-independent protein secretion pathway component TatC